eukprot:705002-Rhodomonas_salina.1
MSVPSLANGARALHDWAARCYLKSAVPVYPGDVEVCILLHQNGSVRICGSESRNYAPATGAVPNLCDESILLPW